MKFTPINSDPKELTLGDLKTGEWFQWKYQNEWVTDTMAKVLANERCTPIGTSRVFRLDFYTTTEWSHNDVVRKVEIDEVKYKVIN